MWIWLFVDLVIRYTNNQITECNKLTFPWQHHISDLAKRYQPALLIGNPDFPKVEAPPLVHYPCRSGNYAITLAS